MTQNKKSLGSSFASFEVASLASGYAALGAITRDESIRILDASSCGRGRFVILMQGTADSLKDSLHRARTALENAGPEMVADQEIIERIEPSIPEALFSLAQAELDESLIVVETETIGGLLSVAQVLVHEHRLKPIELKIHRGSCGGGYGFFTGTVAAVAPAAEDARTHLRSAMREGRVETIDSPSKSFRRFFNISGNE